MKKITGGIIAWLLLILATVVDRFFKFWIETPVWDSTKLGWKYFALERFHNLGISFNIPAPLWLVLPLTGIFLVILYFWTRKTARPWWAFALILAGAVSNAADRWFFGYTIDYLRILTSIINLADIMIVAGIIFLIKKR